MKNQWVVPERQESRSDPDEVSLTTSTGISAE